MNHLNAMLRQYAYPGHLEIEKMWDLEKLNFFANQSNLW